MNPSPFGQDMISICGFIFSRVLSEAIGGCVPRLVHQSVMLSLFGLLGATCGRVSAVVFNVSKRKKLMIKDIHIVEISNKKDNMHMHHYFPWSEADFYYQGHKPAYTFFSVILVIKMDLNVMC